MSLKLRVVHLSSHFCMRKQLLKTNEINTHHIVITENCLEIPVEINNREVKLKYQL